MYLSWKGGHSFLMDTFFPFFSGFQLFSVPTSQQQQQQQTQQTHVPQSSIYSYKPADTYTTPQKYSRAIKGPDRSPISPNR